MKYFSLVLLLSVVVATFAYPYESYGKRGKPHGPPGGGDNRGKPSGGSGAVAGNGESRGPEAQVEGQPQVEGGEKEPKFADFFPQACQDLFFPNKQKEESEEGTGPDRRVLKLLKELTRELEAEAVQVDRQALRDDCVAGLKEREAALVADCFPPAKRQEDGTDGAEPAEPDFCGLLEEARRDLALVLSQERDLINRLSADEQFTARACMALFEGESGHHREEPEAPAPVRRRREEPTAQDLLQGIIRYYKVEEAKRSIFGLCATIFVVGRERREGEGGGKGGRQDGGQGGKQGPQGGGGDQEGPTGQREFIDQLLQKIAEKRRF